MTFEVFHPPRRRQGTPVRTIALRIDPAVLEALDETAEELTVGRSRLIERLIILGLERLELPARAVRVPATPVAL